jgi:hypothetical protein
VRSLGHVERPWGIKHHLNRESKDYYIQYIKKIITIVNIFVSNVVVVKFIKQTLLDKGKDRSMYNNTGRFHYPNLINRLPRQKINKLKTIPHIKRI